MPVNVLLVDDDPDLLTLASEFLKKKDQEFKITLAVSAEEALDIMKENEFDVIVSDYQMPKMNGIEFLRKIREGDQEIAFIIFTGKSREEVAIQALNLGADHYVKKGGDPVSQYTELAHIIQQVSEHRATKTALRQRETERSVIIDSMEQMVAYYNKDSLKVEWVNHAVEKNTGIPESDVIGKYCYEIWHGKDAPCVNCPVIRANKSKEVETGEQRTPDGKVWRLSAYPILDDERELLGIVEVGTDITELRDSTLELAEKQKDLEGKVEDRTSEIISLHELYRTILDGLVSGVWVSDSDDVIRYSNSAMGKIAGTSVSNLEGKEVFRDFPVEATKEFLAVYKEAKENMIPVRYSNIEVRTIEGRQSKQSGWCIPIVRNDQYDGMIVTVEDITAQIETLEALRQSEENYRLIADTIPDGITVIEDGKFIYANKRAFEIFGFSEEDFVSIDGLDIAAPEERKRLREIIKRAIEEDIYPTEIEYWILRPDGVRRRIRNRYAYKKREDGKVTRFTITTDITHHYITESIIRQNEELSDFAHHLAHDLRNHLHNLKGYFEILPETEYDEKIMNILSQMNMLLSRSLVLADAGKVIGTTSSVNLKEIIQEIAASIVPDSISVNIDDLPNVEGDKTRIQQVVTNLIQNAVEHGRPDNIIVRKIIADNHVVICFENDGELIPDEFCEKILKTTFSSKESGGIGLSIIHKIVAAHGWRITLDCSPRTSFKIHIPLQHVHN
ncbi:MAG: PAS domain S-box protein [Candidatus Lokiarchaeota archaeon]|nr:PAS domain S-box protein [Candidatus Lokiarchaeota archaeon]